MKHILYIILISGIFLFQCKEKITSYVEPNISGLESFSVPGINPENIKILDNVIIINLPDDFKGTFIKPDLKLAENYTTSSEAAISGFEFEGKNVTMQLNNKIYGSVIYQICVIPSNPIKISEPDKIYNLAIDYGSEITVPFTFHGTSVTANDSGKLVYEPFIDLINDSTGETVSRLDNKILEDSSEWKLSIELPSTIPTGGYSLVVTWGTTIIKLSKQINIKPGPLRIMRGSWSLLPDKKNFEVAAYNIAKEGKYELIITNDYIQDQKIPLAYKDAGTLTGNFPENIPSGNYRASYLANGKPISTTDYKVGIEKYIGDDNFYLRKYPTQPIIKIISKPSFISSFQTTMGFSVDYYKPTVNIDTSESLMVHLQKSGPFQAKNDILLVNIETRKEYVLSYLNDAYRIFDGTVFLAYDLNISNAIPKGKYEVYAVIGSENEKTEKYSQIIYVK